MEPIDVLIDTDNAMGTLGADPEDGLAIIMALRSPELRVRAVTGVFGNCVLDSVVANTDMLLHTLGREDVPFAAGFAAPLLPGHPAGHPSPALEDGAQVVPPAAAPRKHAVELIIETAAASPERLTIITLGPVTNLAVALAMAPSLRDQIREIVVMGGGYAESNITPSAEFNIWADPDAAHIVFASGIPLRMVGLDVCHQVRLEEEELVEFRAGNELGRLAGRCFDSIPWWPIHLYDTLTVASVARPALLRYLPGLVQVQRHHDASFGQTLVFSRNAASNAQVATKADAEAFKALFRDRVLAPLSSQAAGVA